MDTHLVISHLSCPIPKVWQPYTLATAIVKYFSTSFPATATIPSIFKKSHNAMLHFLLGCSEALLSEDSS